MTQEDLAVLAGFNRVWERVSGQRIDSAPAAFADWEDVLNGVYGHWRSCVSLSAWAVGMPRKRLIGLAGEARELFRNLQTEYFLETGDIFQPRMSENLASYTPYNLQKTYKNAVKLAERLQKAAEACNVSVGDAGGIITDHENALKELLRDCLR